MGKYNFVYICPKCKVCSPTVSRKEGAVCPDCKVKMIEVPIGEKK